MLNFGAQHFMGTFYFARGAPLATKWARFIVTRSWVYVSSVALVFHISVIKYIVY